METGFEIECNACQMRYELNLDTFSAIDTEQWTKSEAIETQCPHCDYHNVTFFGGRNAVSFLYRCHLEQEKEIQELRRLIEIHIIKTHRGR